MSTCLSRLCNLRNIERLLQLHANPLQNVRRKRSFREKVQNVASKKFEINSQNLPLLPIPKLEHTLSKFLKSAEPFVSQCELATAQYICRQFWKNEGSHIQKRLIERARETRNWFNDWYLKCSFLCNRDRIPMNTSPVLLLPNGNFESRCDQLNHAAKIIEGVLKFREICVGDKLPLETWGRHPLDMSVYKRLFAYTRTPKTGCDQIIELPEDSRHIIVAYNNNFFKIVVLNEEGLPLSFYQIMNRLENVLELGCGRGDPFGILTSIRREKWAKAYKTMKCKTDNEELLKDIEEALFVVCLDECSPMKMCTREEKQISAALNGFHGHGMAVNAANRWHDKTLQLFVSLDGSNGFILEQSPIDATPLIKMADFLMSYIKNREFLNVPFVSFCEQPKHLNFVCTDDIKCYIQEGCEETQESTKKFSCQLLQYDAYGKDFCKEHNLSADAIVQVAIQLAYLATHGHLVPQQEIVTTRKFFLGRNDVIRSCTCEMMQFIKSINYPLISTKDRLDLLKDTSKMHRQLCVEAMEGRAIDCHLFGLIMACRQADWHLPKIFQSSAYLKSSRFKILSMQTLMESDCYLCYPPSCHGGYAVCYNPRKDDFNICVTSRGDNCDINSKKLLDFLGCEMKKLSKIMCGCESKTKRCD